MADQNTSARNNDEDVQLTAAYSGATREAIDPPEAFARGAHVRSFDDYQREYDESVSNPEAYWKRKAERLDWYRPFERVREVSYARDELSIKWFKGGKLNASYNCIDRHLSRHGSRVALIFEPDDPEAESRRIHTARCMTRFVGSRTC